MNRKGTLIQGKPYPQLGVFKGLACLEPARSPTSETQPSQKVLGWDVSPFILKTVLNNRDHSAPVLTVLNTRDYYLPDYNPIKDCWLSGGTSPVLGFKKTLAEMN